VRHERVDQIVAAGLLAGELEEQVREAVVRLRLLELRPIVELRIGQAQERLGVRNGEPVRLLAELRLSLVEPHRRPLLLRVLDHVTELVRDHGAQIGSPRSCGERVDVHRLALGGEFIDPQRELIR